MFELTSSPGALVARVVIVFAFLFALLRVFGKRHVGEMAPFDLVVLLILSECVQNALIADEKSVTGGLITSFTLIAMSQVVTYVTWKNKSLERILEGTPRLLVRNGQVNEDVLARERVTRSELIEAMRKEGVSSLTRVRYAMLENDGSISFGIRTEPCRDSG